MIIGDINQLDSYEDKLGGAVFIRGWEEFQDWKYSLLLQDMPFFGPRYTWSNAKEGDDLILERLDRAYATQDWLDEFPNVMVRNLPITISDHAPIILQMDTPNLNSRRLYQIETWCLNNPTVGIMIREVWATYIPGSPRYVLSRRLFMARERLKQWCLDRRLFRGINWNEIFSKLQHQGDNIHTLQQGCSYMHTKSGLIEEASIGVLYWKQGSRTISHG